MNNLIESLNWRYATKKYDEGKEISQEDYNSIKEAIRLTPTSYGLQLFTVLDVASEELKKSLVEASWGQQQPVSASKYLILAVPEEITDQHIDDFVSLREEGTGAEAGSLKGYGDFIKSKKLNLSKEENQNWLAKQAYIALGMGLAQAAHLRIDATPMEGFEADKYIDILGLKEKGLVPVVAVAFGYRAEDDAYQHHPKVRRAEESLFEVL